MSVQLVFTDTREVKVPSESKYESSSVPEFKSSKDHNCIIMNSTKVRHKMQVELLAEPKTPLESSVFI